MCDAPDCGHAGRPASRGRNWHGPFRRTPGRLFGMGFIRLYQLTLSGFIGNSCRHLPTCSEYGYEAIARHGLWQGGFMTLFRVMRCGPGGTHGFDPVPEALEDRFAWWAPWRLWRVSRAGKG
jgi:uncharacterized protein